MKRDTQHLDFLISQYVDGCLDASSKKSLEQSLLNDPQARKLYKEQRDVQDVLDDWGNRIPLINWEQFDAQLAARLENETVGSERTTAFRRWARPASIAASLVLAATLGYAWHAYSTSTTAHVARNDSTTSIARPVKFATIDEPGHQRPAFRGIKIDERAAQNSPAPKIAKVEATPPDEDVAVNSLKDAIRYGLGNEQKGLGSATATTITPQKDNDKEKSTDSAIPYP